MSPTLTGHKNPAGIKGCMAGGSKDRARNLEKELFSILAKPGLCPQPGQGLEEGEKAPSRAQGGQKGSWERTQPTQVLQRCKTQHSSPVGGWESFPSTIKKNVHLSRGGQAGHSPEGNRAQQEMKNGNAGLSRTGKQQNKHNCGLPALAARWL